MFAALALQLYVGQGWGLFCVILPSLWNKNLFLFILWLNVLFEVESVYAEVINSFVSCPFLESQFQLGSPTLNFAKLNWWPITRMVYFIFNNIIHISMASFFMPAYFTYFTINFVNLSVNVCAINVLRGHLFRIGHLHFLSTPLVHSAFADRFRLHRVQAACQKFCSPDRIVCCSIKMAYKMVCTSSHWPSERSADMPCAPHKNCARRCVTITDLSNHSAMNFLKIILLYGLHRQRNIHTLSIMHSLLKQTV